MVETDATNSTRIGVILWREKFLILAAVVLMVGLAAIYTVRSPKVYQASGVIQVNLPSGQGTSDTTDANEALAQNYAALLVSPGFLSLVRPTVEHGSLSVSALQARLTASAIASSALVQLNATGPSPASAQTVAAQVMSGFLTYLQASANHQSAALQADLQQSISTLSDKIAALQSAPPTAATTERLVSLKAQLAALITQNASLVSSGIAAGTSATLAAAPVASSDPISPRKSLNILGGLILGLVLGVALAWTRHTLRPAIHSAEDVTSITDLPLLASIPLKPRFKPDDAGLSEAYRILHANLMFALRVGDKRVVTFVGYNQGVGKSSTVEGVGRAAASSDRPVLVVDGDLRAGTLSERLGYSDHLGIAEVLQSSLPLDRALVEIEDGLWLLPTRPSFVNPASLLAGSRTPAVIAELRERFDLVLIDSPPLAGLADGLVLGSLSDAVVLIVRAGVTKPADLTAATTGLLQNMTPIAGTVVFQEQPDESYYPTQRSQASARAGAIAG